MTPSLQELLCRIAKKAVRGMHVPRHVTLPRLAYEDVVEVERYFHTNAKSLPDGRFRIELEGEFATALYWRNLAPSLGIAPEVPHEADDEFERVKLSVPECGALVDALAARDEIRRFVAKRENAGSWRKLCIGVLRRLQSHTPSPITLSQLGSDIFNDSKVLRSGPLRRQLALILAVASCAASDDEAQVFARANIEDNPYTSFVAFSAPVDLVFADGTRDDFPRRMFCRSLATQLPLATVRELAAVEGSGTIVTSENAAPFARMIAGRHPCLYTGGHPGSAVRRLLAKLAEAGVECVHEGDADLDGFVIAAEIGGCIPVTRVVASEMLRLAPPDAGIEFDDIEKKRMEAFLSSPSHRDFPYRSEIENILSRGRWIEQESFASLLSLHETPSLEL